MRCAKVRDCTFLIDLKNLPKYSCLWRVWRTLFQCRKKLNSVAPAPDSVDGFQNAKSFFKLVGFEKAEKTNKSSLEHVGFEEENKRKPSFEWVGYEKGKIRESSLELVGFEARISGKYSLDLDFSCLR